METDCGKENREGIIQSRVIEEVKIHSVRKERNAVEEQKI